MEQKNESCETPSLVKNRIGQSGADGHAYRRTKRIELRVSPIEHAQLCAIAIGAGYKNLAQFLRESGLNTGRGLSPTADYHHQLLWLQVINRIGDHIDKVASQLAHGKEPDEEMLLYLMQIQELAEQVWKETRKGDGPIQELT